MVIDLFGSHAIYDRIEHWWHYDIKVGQKYMYIARHIPTKAVCHEGKESWGVEGKDDTDMRPTSAEGLEPGFPRREMKYNT